MILSHQLPNPVNYNPKQDGGSSINSAIIIDANITSSYEYPEHASPMGILCSFNGSANYKINKRTHTTNDDYFIILNQNSRISIDIDVLTPMNSFYVFFPDDIINKVTSVYNFPLNKLIDEPYILGVTPKFVERPHRYGDSAIYSIIAALKKGSFEQQYLSERINDLFALLLEINTGCIKDIQKINAIKKSTREEIYIRLYKAKFYMDENFSLPITLEDIAEYATLNSFHLLRLFKQLFKITPYQYLTKIRLNEAARLILKTSMTITEICHSIGFESITSFSLLFKRNYNCSPQVFRLNCKK